MPVMGLNRDIFTCNYCIVDFSTLNYLEITGLNDPWKYTDFLRNTQITNPQSLSLYITV